MDDHERRVNAVRARIQQRPNDECRKRFVCTTRHASTGVGHCVRGPAYKEGAWTVDVTDLNHVLCVDVASETCLVEPGVTMEKLCRILLQHGYLPPVVPEFRCITVGGAIMGLGLESSSFRHGMFEDSVNNMRMILGDSNIILVSAENEHSELFYGTFGSYASLGILVSVELKIVRASSLVRINYQSITPKEAACGTVLCHPSKGEDIDFCEGVIFSNSRASRVTAKFVNLEKSDDRICCKVASIIPSLADRIKILDITHWRHTWGQWFFEFVESRPAEGWSEVVPTLDYLFRWDRGAYWCAMLSERLPSNICARLALGGYFSAQRAYSIEHASKTNNDFHRIVQDCCVPEGSRLRRFLEFVNESYGIYPIWLCPVRNVLAASGRRKQKLFSLPSSPSGRDVNFYVNVGVYGIPRMFHGKPWHLSYIEGNRALHDATVRMKGARAYYSTSYCTREEFWKHHDKEAYEKLRAKYAADGVYIDIYTKVTSKFPPPPAITKSM